MKKLERKQLGNASEYNDVNISYRDGFVEDYQDAPGFASNNFRSRTTNGIK